MQIGNYVFFIKTRKISLSRAYKHFGVKRKTYMGSVVKRIYNYYCTGADNLFLTYLIHYRKEYQSFREYLEKHFNLFPDEIEKVNSWRLHGKNLELQPENNMQALLDDAEIKKQLMNSYMVMMKR